MSSSSESDPDYEDPGEDDFEEDEFEIVTSSSDDDDDRGVGAVVREVGAAAARRSARLRRGAPSATPGPSPPPPTPPVVTTPLAQEVCLRSASDSTTTLGPRTPAPLVPSLLRARGTAAPGFSAAQRAHLAGAAFAPRHPAAIVDALHSRAYVGFFSPSGNKLVAGFQHDRRLRVYDSSLGSAVGAATADVRPPSLQVGGGGGGRTPASGVVPGFPLLKDISCRMLRWTITDVALDDGEAVCAYASICPVAHIVSLGGATGVSSVANTTDIHAACPLDEVLGAPPDARLPPFGVWALRFAPSGGGGDGAAPPPSTLVAGGDGKVYIHDVARAKTTDVLSLHGDDVNALAFLDPASPSVFASGGDDGLVKLVDRRVGGGRRGQSDGGMAAAAAGTAGAAVGLLAGHLAGITHLDARGDGVHLLSTSKDQTSKLWDARRAGPDGPGAEEAALSAIAASGGAGFDYRWMRAPRRLMAATHPGDASVATYRGHSVLSTLIRSRFSPPGPTGGRFIYAGSADGTPRVWDLVTTAPVAELAFHGEPVRDISWHPTEPAVLVTASFDGTLVRWGPAGEAGGVPDAAGGDALEDRF